MRSLLYAHTCHRARACVCFGEQVLTDTCPWHAQADEREGLVQDLLRVWNKPSHRTSGRAKLFVLEWVLGHCPAGSSVRGRV